MASKRDVPSRPKDLSALPQPVRSLSSPIPDVVCFAGAWDRMMIVSLTTNPHRSVGDRTVEIGVWETPGDIKEEVLEEVLARCKTMWVEKTLARLAIPEVLEYVTLTLPSPPHFLFLRFA